MASVRVACEMPSVLQPDIQSCLLCEDVRQEVNGNFILLGILGAITVPQLPITAARLLLFTRWCCGEGGFKFSNRILLPDQSTLLTSSEGEFVLKSADDHLTQVTLFTHIQFQQKGIYWVEVHLDGELKLRFPLPVRVVPLQA